MKVWKEECRKGSAVPTDRRPLPRGLLFFIRTRIRNPKYRPLWKQAEEDSRPMFQIPSDRGKNSGECPFPSERRENKASLPSILTFPSSPLRLTRCRTNRHPSFRSEKKPLQKGLPSLAKRSVPCSFPCPGIGPRRSLPAPPESGSEHRLKPSLRATDPALKKTPLPLHP